MKTIYRRPFLIPPIALVLFTLITLITLYFVEHHTPSPILEKMRQTIEKHHQGMKIIQAQKQKLALMARDLEDPKQTGLIGSWKTTPITSTFSHLSAKQTSTNPQFAALVYQWLKEVGVQKGDTVAVSASGSFPGLNLATYSALEVLEAKPLVILSLTASQWGANQPEILWVDMSTLLYQSGLFHIQPIAVSYGAKNDHAENISSEGKEILHQAIHRNGSPELIKTGSLLGNINKKWHLYQKSAGKHQIKAFINIGGGSSSVGSNKDKKQLFKPGINTELPEIAQPDIPGLMWKFYKSGVPLIHLSNIPQIARENQISDSREMPVFHHSGQKQAGLSGLVLLFLFLIAIVFYQKKKDALPAL